MAMQYATYTGANTATTNTAAWNWDVTTTATTGTITFANGSSFIMGCNNKPVKKKKKPQPREKNGQLLFW